MGVWDSTIAPRHLPKMQWFRMLINVGKGYSIKKVSGGGVTTPLKKILQVGGLKKIVILRMGGLKDFTILWVGSIVRPPHMIMYGRNSVGGRSE